MLSVFHPTVTEAALTTADGIRIPPYGRIAIIGLPNLLAVSISYCIQRLYIAYIPDITRTQQQGLIFRVIALCISMVV